MKPFVFKAEKGKVPQKLIDYINSNNGKWLEIARVPETRSDSQNRALHKFFSLLADTLNDMGLDMRKVLKPTYFIPWNTQAVKDHLWRPFQIAITGKESTTKLTKLDGEIDEIHKVLMRELGEKKHVPFIKFPSKCPRCQHIDCACDVY